MQASDKYKLRCECAAINAPTLRSSNDNANNHATVVVPTIERTPAEFAALLVQLHAAASREPTGEQKSTCSIRPPLDGPMTDGEMIVGLSSIEERFRWAREQVRLGFDDEHTRQRVQETIRTTLESMDGVRSKHQPQHRTADLRNMVIESILARCEELHRMREGGWLSSSVATDELVADVFEHAVEFAQPRSIALTTNLTAGAAQVRVALRKVLKHGSADHATRSSKRSAPPRRDCIFELENILNGETKASTVDARRSAERRHDDWLKNRSTGW